MTSSKVLVSLFVAVVLSLQAISQVLQTGGRLWPFMNYPMYSKSHAPGETISLNELRAVSGDEEDAGRSIQPSELDMTYYVFHHYLRRAILHQHTMDIPEGDGAAKLLSDVAASRLAPSTRKLQIWTRTFEIGHSGLVSRDVPAELVREWSVPYSTVDGEISNEQ